MLTQEEDVEASALRKQGWSISAIARHLGHDRKTIRAYLAGTRSPGRRASTQQDPFDLVVEYCRIRLGDDPHVWATTLFDEAQGLGYAGSYPSFTRNLRIRRLRPHCEACDRSNGREHAIIDHPAGEETQFDWVELPDPPPGWGCGTHAHLLVGALAHSSRWRGVLAESEDQPHLVDALDGVVRRLGGCTKEWRFDRMATVCSPDTGKVTGSFAAVAKHYGVGVRVCPARRGNRKGVVEKGNDSLTQRWWRTVPDDFTLAQAQDSLDRFCRTIGDGRTRRVEGAKTTVGALAEAEPLMAPPPTAYPAVIEASRVVSAQALVAYRGNFYSLAPGMPGATVTVRHRLTEPMIDIATASGVVIARHRREPDGAGAIVRATDHVAALQKKVLTEFTTAGPCRHKQRRPPSPAALAEADRVRGTTRPVDRQVVVDLAVYAEAAQHRTQEAKTLPTATIPDAPTGQERP